MAVIGEGGLFCCLLAISLFFLVKKEKIYIICIKKTKWNILPSSGLRIFLINIEVGQSR